MIVNLKKIKFQLYMNLLPRKFTARKRALVFGITDDLYFALGTMLVGYFKHNPMFNGTVVVFHENLSKEQQATLRKIYKTISFRRFTRSGVEKRLSKIASRTRVEAILARYSHFYFAKFEIPDLLKEFHKVMWMDVDMLVRGPVGNMWSFDQFTWRIVSPGALEKQEVVNQAYALDIKRSDYGGPNGGLIGISRGAQQQGEMSTARLYYWFNRLTNEHNLAISDELSFFLLAATTGSNLKELPLSYNCPSATHGAGSAKIIHAVGKNKFWNTKSIALAYPDWGIWQREWVRYGGTKSHYELSGKSGFIQSPNSIVGAARQQHIWSKLFEEIRDQLPAGVIPDLHTHRQYWQILFAGWKKELLHIEITKLGKTYRVEVHLEGDAQFVEAHKDLIEKRLATVEGFERMEFECGDSWGCEVEIDDVATKVIVCANALSGIQYFAPTDRLDIQNA
jgi:lipopolysaccharide biosynthesis glycosyltransferase